MTLISDYAEAVSLPKAVKRQRLCQYAGVFCAFCPDVERLPCVLAGGLHDCETCTLPDCACMRLPTSKRRAAHVAWKKRHVAANNAATRKRRTFNRKNNYSKGLVCSRCGTAITNKGKSGLCPSCARKARA